MYPLYLPRFLSRLEKCNDPLVGPTLGMGSTVWVGLKALQPEGHNCRLAVLELLPVSFVPYLEVWSGVFLYGASGR